MDTSRPARLTRRTLEELKEELGIEASAADPVPIYVMKGEAQKHFGQIYVLCWSGDLASLRFNNGEVERVKWIPLNELEHFIDAGKFCNSFDHQVVEYLALAQVKI